MRAIAFAVSLASTLIAASGAAAEGAQDYELSGTVGPYLVGMSLIVQPDHRTISAAHYFYASKLADIALHPTATRDAVTLSEPGGGVFRLHFVGNGSAPPPLDFYTSVGLAGIWTQGATSLPVKLQMQSSGASGEPGHRYALITRAPDAVVEGAARRFLQGVLNGNRDEAARAVSYPLQVNGARSHRIANKAALLAHWDVLFTPKYLAVLKTAVPHDMFVNAEGAMVADGAVWFDDKGATVLNVAR